MEKIILVISILWSCAAFSGNPVRAALLQASKKYNVPYKLLSKIADLESNFKEKAKSNTATASGLFQIIRSTEIGLKRQCKISGSIFDAKTNALLAACGLNKNIKYLRRKLRRNPRNVEVYLTHFFGPRNAWRFLRLKGNVKAAKVFPKQARANKYIFYRKGRMRTKAEIYKLFKTKLRKARVL